MRWSAPAWARMQASALGLPLHVIICAPMLGALEFVAAFGMRVSAAFAAGVALLQRFCSAPVAHGVDWYTVPDLASLHL